MQPKAYCIALRLIYMSLVMRKPFFCIGENKDADQLRGYTAKLISAFAFATRTVQFLYFLNLNFQASSHRVWLYSPVCVGPGQKTRRPVFSMSLIVGTPIFRFIASSDSNIVYMKQARTSGDIHFLDAQWQLTP